MCRNIYQWTGKTETTGKKSLGTLVVEPKAAVFDKIFSLNSNVYQFVLIDNNHHIFRNTTELSEQNIVELIKLLPISESLFYVRKHLFRKVPLCLLFIYYRVIILRRTAERII